MLLELKITDYIHSSVMIHDTDELMDGTSTRRIGLWSNHLQYLEQFSRASIWRPDWIVPEFNIFVKDILVPARMSDDTGNSRSGTSCRNILAEVRLRLPTVGWITNAKSLFERDMIYLNSIINQY